MTLLSDAARDYARAHGERFRQELHEMLRIPSLSADPAYASDVRTKAFPGPSESYHLSAEVAETLGLYGRPA